MNNRNRKQKAGSKPEDILKEKGRLVLTAEGFSMLPCIHPITDVLFLEQPKEKIRPLQVILYKRKSGGYVLHRVMEVREEGCVLCGDNQYKKEYGIQDSQILGVLKGFYRGEVYVDCEKSRGYQRYVKLWCSPFFPRRIAVWIIKIGRRIGKV